MINEQAIPIVVDLLIDKHEKDGLAALKKHVNEHPEYKDLGYVRSLLIAAVNRLAANEQAEEQQLPYVEETPGNLPYLIFYQSKGGWPTFDTVATYEEALRKQKALGKSGLRVEIYRWIER